MRPHTSKNKSPTGSRKTQTERETESKQNEGQTGTEGNRDGWRRTQEESMSQREIIRQEKGRRRKTEKENERDRREERQLERKSGHKRKRK